MTFTQERMTKQQQQQMQDKEQEAELRAPGGMISIWEIHFWPEKWHLYDLDLPPSPRLVVANEALVWNLSDPKNVMSSLLVTIGSWVGGRSNIWLSVIGPLNLVSWELI